MADVLIGPRHDDIIGGGGPAGFFDGFINEARVYTGVMTAADIAAIFALGVDANGDLNGNGALDAPDIDLLSTKVRAGSGSGAFDLNGDNAIDQEDRRIWVEEIKRTYFGDADLDGRFSSEDLVGVFVTGEYEDGVAGNSGWSDGDWDGNADFESNDLVVAFIAGGYEQGERPPVQAVPEPASLWLLVCGLLAWIVQKRGSRCRPRA